MSIKFGFAAKLVFAVTGKLKFFRSNVCSPVLVLSSLSTDSNNECDMVRLLKKPLIDGSAARNEGGDDGVMTGSEIDDMYDDDVFDFGKLK